jgi:NADH-quinone oxidoreductase subunit C
MTDVACILIQEFDAKNFDVHGVNCVVLNNKNDIKDIVTKIISFGYDCLIDIFCTHYPERNKEFELSYNFLNIETKSRLMIKLNIDKDEEIDSIQSILSPSTWYEREIFDMYGVKFFGATDMRRILNEYDFKHFPLRKDFPLSGYDEVYYDYDTESVKHKPVSLNQEFRQFDFETPWNMDELFKKLNKK